jgi:hypothetical protein
MRNEKRDLKSLFFVYIGGGEGNGNEDDMISFF